MLSHAFRDKKKKVLPVSVLRFHNHNNGLFHNCLGMWRLCTDVTRKTRNKLMCSRWAIVCRHLVYADVSQRSLEVTITFTYEHTARHGEGWCKGSVPRCKCYAFYIFSLCTPPITHDLNSHKTRSVLALFIWWFGRLISSEGCGKGSDRQRGTGVRHGKQGDAAV